MRTYISIRSCNSVDIHTERETLLVVVRLTPINIVLSSSLTLKDDTSADSDNIEVEV